MSSNSPSRRLELEQDSLFSEDISSDDDDDCGEEFMFRRVLRKLRSKAAPLLAARGVVAVARGCFS